jgi:hypothetical protein
MSQPTNSLIGHWQKVTNSACSSTYPDHIEFRDRGLYFGRKIEPGSFTLWDVGTYEPVSRSEIKLSTANDAVVSYRVEITNDTMTFVDPEGCRFQYRRASS